MADTDSLIRPREAVTAQQGTARLWPLLLVRPVVDAVAVALGP